MNLTNNREFKIKLLEKGMNIKQFCEERGINYAVFNLGLNNLNHIQDEHQKAIDEFMGIQPEKQTNEKE
jgi:hypothetical protein